MEYVWYSYDIQYDSRVCSRLSTPILLKYYIIMIEQFDCYPGLLSRICYIHRPAAAGYTLHLLLEQIVLAYMPASLHIYSIYITIYLCTIYAHCLRAPGRDGNAHASYSLLEAAPEHPAQSPLQIPLFLSLSPSLSLSLSLSLSPSPTI